MASGITGPLDSWRKFDQNAAAAQETPKPDEPWHLNVNHAKSVTKNLESGFESLKFWKAYSPDNMPDGVRDNVLGRILFGSMAAVASIVGAIKDLAIDVPTHAAMYGASKLFDSDK